MQTLREASISFVCASVGLDVRLGSENCPSHTTLHYTGELECIYVRPGTTCNSSRRRPCVQGGQGERNEKTSGNATFRTSPSALNSPVTMRYVTNMTMRHVTNVTQRDMTHSESVSSFKRGQKVRNAASALSVLFRLPRKRYPRQKKGGETIPHTIVRNLPLRRGAMFLIQQDAVAGT